MRGIIRTPMSTNPNESARHVSYDGGHESMLANTPPTRKNLPSLEKLPAWMPATKHRHAVTGCAPNGLRLFSPPPSLLLSSRMKKSRDAQLTRKLEGLKSEITSFENTHLRRATDSATSHKSFGGQASGVDSLENISLAHGRMMSDLREMEQVVTKRCQSRWEPGLIVAYLLDGLPHPAHRPRTACEQYRPMSLQRESTDPSASCAYDHLRSWA